MDLTPEQLVQHANERFQLRDYYGAIHCLEDVVETGRAFADAYHLLGLCYSMIGQPEKALDRFEQALELNPRYHEAHIHRAIVLNDLGRPGEAEESFSSARESLGEPRNGLPSNVAAKLANTHAQLGEAYADAGAIDRALAQYEAAIELGPGFHDLRFRLARLLLDAGRAMDAREHLELIVRQRPALAEAHAALGLACYLAGDGLAAREVWERHLAERPQDARVQGYLAMLKRAAE